MKGAREYADLFKKSGQKDKLVWIVGSHARGKTFRLYILPEGEKARWATFFHENPPINTNAVEVYGVVSGNPGWTEEYGWLHYGQWQRDFEDLVDDTRFKIREEYLKNLAALNEANSEKEARIKALLEAY
jgi:hypothetical protein